MKKHIMIGCLLWIFPFVSVFAVKLTSLYQAELPVSSQAADERAIAVKQGFAQLLIRLTGNPDIGKNPDIKDAMQRADYYVQEFSYSAPSMNASTYFVHVVFDTNDVNRLLRKAGIAYWGDRRPLILVWMTVTDLQGSAEIIGSETPGNVSELMQHQGKKYGLPLIFPMMDVTDMSQVTPSEINIQSLPLLKQVGKRYAPNAYLVGNIATTGDGYTSQWQLILNKTQWTWTITDKSMDNVVATVLLQASQVLSKYYESKS